MAGHYRRVGELDLGSFEKRYENLALMTSHAHVTCPFQEMFGDFPSFLLGINNGKIEGRNQQVMMFMPNLGSMMPYTQVQLTSSMFTY